jgi:hypothetical protein
VESLPDEPGGKGPNYFVVWLKDGEVRNVKYQKAVISETEAILSIARAVSKYNVVYGGISVFLRKWEDLWIGRQKRARRSFNAACFRPPRS